MTEIIFEVTEDEVDGGYSASAIGYGIHTQGDSMEEIRRNVREAVDCYFDEGMQPAQTASLRYAPRDPRPVTLPRNVGHCANTGASALTAITASWPMPT